MPTEVDIQDTFDRSNGALAGSTSSDTKFTWNESLNGTVAATIATNRMSLVRGTTDSYSIESASVELSSADQYCQVDIVSMGPKSLAGPAVRMDTASEAGSVGYMFLLQASDNTYSFYDLTGGGTLIASTGASGATSGTLYLSFEGSAYICKANGVTIFSGTDTAHAGGTGSNKVGIVTGVQINNGETILFDNFRAANLHAQPPRTMHQARLRR